MSSVSGARLVSEKRTSRSAWRSPRPRAGAGFTTERLTDLIDSLEEAEAAGRLNHRLKTLTHPALLVVDEIGYLPLTRSGAILFFQLVNRRYEHASTVVTSNKGFEQWGEILHDEVMAAALLDRLLHRCHMVNIRGNSYRMRRHVELSKAIHPTASRAVSAEPAGNGEAGS